MLGSFGQPPLCLVERAAAAHFGIKVRSTGSITAALRPRKPAAVCPCSVAARATDGHGACRVGA